MATRVYHYKHGWIRLDHTDAPSAPGGGAALHPVQQASLPRRQHVVAGFSSKSGTFVVHDSKTGHTANLTTMQAGGLQKDGHRITAVHPDGVFDTTHHKEGDTTQHAWTPQDVAVAQRLVADAEKAEPNLTRLMTKLSREHYGTLAGLDFKIKGESSLARKISTDVHDEGISSHEAGAAIFDANRYTMLFHQAEYTARAQAVIAQLRSLGYKVEIRNYWTNGKNPYQGINMKVTSPTGKKFELQFHTPESLRVKEGELHRLYEKHRISLSKKEKDRLEREMFRVTAKIPVPPGVHRLKRWIHSE